MADRSYLYVPGHRPDRFAKAWASGTDAVIFDVEDAVPMAAKAEALVHVVEHLRSHVNGGSAWVRINAGDAGLDEADQLGGLSALTGVVVPKATPDIVTRLRNRVGDMPVIALVESAQGMTQCAEIAALPSVVTLAMGEVDLAADLGLLPEAPDAVWWGLRTSVVVAAAAAACPGPLGPVGVDFRDLVAYERSTRELRAAGFGGRQAIHPDQVAVINAVFTPSANDVAQARRLLELAQAAQGGVCVDDAGRMVDEAVLRSARRILGSDT